MQGDTNRLSLENMKQMIKSSILPLTNEIEASNYYPKELINELGKKGCLGVSIPIHYGGIGVDPIVYGKFIEEIGKVCTATRTLITVHTSLVCETILKYGTKEQKQEWLPALVSGEKIGAFALSEPNVGSNAKNVLTTYKSVEGDFVVTGNKKWISFGELADVFLVIASNSENGMKSAFIIEREQAGVQTIPIKGMMAGRGTHIAEIKLDNVKVPRNRLIGIEGSGFDFVASYALDQGRYSVAWGGVGLAQAAIEAIINYANHREQFGKKLGEHQLIQAMITEAITKTHAARALCYKAGAERKEKKVSALNETMIAKYFASKIAVEIANDAVQIYGAKGFVRDYGVERLYREAKVLEIIEGTSQVLQEIISKEALNNINEKW
ncbi:acyl-CoA dehydrogenase family protein [Bacillus thuringiensis]|uniref:acyl-CoA dehydrogenase family protein n=1 Tax=Bacillus tropicus TaxID=2026188 RepID=UPI0035DE70AC